MVWGLEKGSRDCVTMSRETGNQKKKKNHKNGKLDTVTFKLIGQKLHAFGPEPTKNKQINSNKDIKTAVIPVFGVSSPLLSVYAEGFVSLSFKINFACMSFCQFVNSIVCLCEQNSVPHFNNILYLGGHEKIVGWSNSTHIDE